MRFTQFTHARPKHGIIGHRGIASLAPENTLASFKLAAEFGIECIEFDLRLIDNQLVIFHDDSLERTTNGHGLIDKKSAHDIAELDAGSWFHPRFKNERIPFFTNVLTELLQLPLSLNIELKLADLSSKLHIQRLAKHFLQVMRDEWPKTKPLPLISSFYWPILYVIRSHLPDIPLGFLTETCTPQLIRSIAQIQNSALHTNFTALTPELIALANELEVPILAYTVNQTAIASQLLDANVFAVFSDKPLFMVPSFL